MTERPILFNGEMVRAILAGRKTQTRRVNGLDRVNDRRDELDALHRSQTEDFVLPFTLLK